MKDNYCLEVTRVRVSGQEKGGLQSKKFLGVQALNSRLKTQIGSLKKDRVQTRA